MTYSEAEVKRQQKYRLVNRKAPIFLDDFRHHNPDLGRVVSHLFTIPRNDKTLGRFAFRIGLLQSSVITTGNFSRVLLPEHLRAKAIELGAIEIPYADAVTLVKAAKIAEETGDDLDGEAAELLAFYTLLPELRGRR